MHCYKATYSMAVLVSTDELKIRKKKEKKKNKKKTPTTYNELTFLHAVLVFVIYYLLMVNQLGIALMEQAK